MSEPDTSLLPDSLTLFVKNSHAVAVKRHFDTNQFARLQLELKQLIEQANNNNKLWTNDWSKQQLPVLGFKGPLQLYCDSDFAKRELRKQKKQKSRLLIDEDDLMNSESRKKSRLERFETDQTSDLKSTNYSKGPIKGTCQTLEKSYLRLTSEPDPSRVRPLLVLKKAFNLIYKKYKEGAKYPYICDQLKSIRQDLRVQLIENEFSVTVYETHARIAIENKDLGEFNQCQTVLKNLYHLSHISRSSCYHEFLSYRILYFILTKNFDQITLIKLRLSAEDKLNSNIKFSLNFLKYQISNNYYQLFKLYSTSKATTKHLLDYFINSERVRALSIICYSYKIINLEFLLDQFKFTNEQDCMTFISNNNIDKFIELRGENVYLNTASARSTILQNLNETKKVDIKGQI